MYWLLIDIIALFLIIVIIVVAYRRGFLRSLLSLFGFLIAGAFSFIFGKMIAEGIFDSLVRPWLTTLVETEVVAGTNNNIAAAVENMYVSLPGLFSGPLNFLFGSKEEITNSLNSAVTENAAGLTGSIVDLLRPMIVVLISILTILILFILCSLALRVIDRLLIQVRRLPVIGTFDGLLGAVVGVLQALFWMFILVFLAKAVILLSAGELSWLNDEVVNSTLLFRWFYNFDITRLFVEINL